MNIYRNKMSNPYRPPHGRVDREPPMGPRGRRCALAFVSGIVWSIVVIAVFFLLTNTAPLLVALSWVHYDRVAGISFACGTVCAVSVFFFRRYPLWLNWIVGLLPMLLLGFALFIDDILL